jgi:hypothetical protein
MDARFPIGGSDTFSQHAIQLAFGLPGTIAGAGFQCSRNRGESWFRSVSPDHATYAQSRSQVIHFIRSGIKPSEGMINQFFTGKTLLVLDGRCKARKFTPQHSIERVSPLLSAQENDQITSTNFTNRK